jgi:hypothetical protein
MTKICKNKAEFFLLLVFTKIAIYVSQGLLQDVQATEEALKREHLAFKQINLLTFFIFLWAISALLDPDPDSQHCCKQN